MAAAAVFMAAAACGGTETAPVDQQPKLAALLADVDKAVTSGRYLQARESLDQLQTATESARDAGALDDASADRVLATAAQLRTELTATIEQRRAAVTPVEPIPSDEGGGEVDEKPKPKPDPGHGDKHGDEHGHGHGHGDKPGHEHGDKPGHEHGDKPRHEGRH
jgi:hypothetical protein